MKKLILSLALACATFICKAQLIYNFQVSTETNSYAIQSTLNTEEVYHDVFRVYPYTKTVFNTDSMVGPNWFITPAIINSWNQKVLEPIVSNFSSQGPVQITKRWHGTILPNTSNGCIIDISSAGFANVINVQVIGARNTAIVSALPHVSLKTVNTSQIVVNISEVNTAVINILGNSVLSGLPMVFAATNGITLYVLVEGN